MVGDPLQRVAAGHAGSGLTALPVILVVPSYFSRLQDIPHADQLVSLGRQSFSSVRVWAHTKCEYPNGVRKNLLLKAQRR